MERVITEWRRMEEKRRLESLDGKMKEEEGRSKEEGQWREEE